MSNLQETYLLSQMSTRAYDNNPRKIDGWTVTNTVVDPKTGFAACAYKNNSTGSIVIAYRGTDDKAGDLVADKAFIDIGPNDWHKQFDEALEFAKRVKEQNPNAVISVTGHSLGGGMAQIVSQAYGFHGETFDAPGAKNCVQSPEFKQWMNQNGLPTNGKGAPSNFENHIVYKSAISSTTGQHVGSVEVITGLGNATDLDKAKIKDWSDRKYVPSAAGQYAAEQTIRHRMERIEDYYAGRVQGKTYEMSQTDGGVRFATNDSLSAQPTLSATAENLKQKCDSNVRGFCEQHGQPWTHGMERTVVLSAAVAREAKMTDIEMFAVKDGNINLGQKDATGFGYITAQVNAREAANTPIEQALERLVAADQKMIEQENVKLQQTQTITQSGPKMV